MRATASRFVSRDRGAAEKRRCARVLTLPRAGLDGCGFQSELARFGYSQRPGDISTRPAARALRAVLLPPRRRSLYGSLANDKSVSEGWRLERSDPFEAGRTDHANVTERGPRRACRYVTDILRVTWMMPVCSWRSDNQRARRGRRKGSERRNVCRPAELRIAEPRCQPSRRPATAPLRAPAGLVRERGLASRTLRTSAVP